MIMNKKETNKFRYGLAWFLIVFGTVLGYFSIQYNLLLYYFFIAVISEIFGITIYLFALHIEDFHLNKK